MPSASHVREQCDAIRSAPAEAKFAGATHPAKLDSGAPHTAGAVVVWLLLKKTMAFTKTSHSCHSGGIAGWNAEKRLGVSAGQKSGGGVGGGGGCVSTVGGKHRAYMAEYGAHAEHAVAPALWQLASCRLGSLQ